MTNTDIKKIVYFEVQSKLWLASKMADHHAQTNQHLEPGGAISSLWKDKKWYNATLGEFQSNGTWKVLWETGQWSTNVPEEHIRPRLHETRKCAAKAASSRQQFNVEESHATALLQEKLQAIMRGRQSRAIYVKMAKEKKCMSHLEKCSFAILKNANFGILGA